MCRAGDVKESMAQDQSNQLGADNVCSVVRETGTLAAMAGVMEGVQGRWTFEPLPRWERMPAGYYSLRRSSIYLRLFLRVPDEDIRFCMRNDLLAPAGLKPHALRAWIAGARAAVRW